MIHIEQSEQDDVVVLAPVGRLNVISAAQLKKREDQVVQDGGTRIVVDLSGATFIDSSGLGALVGGLRRTRMAGGDLRVAGAKGQVRSALHLTNLDRVLGPYETVEDALVGW